MASASACTIVCFILDSSTFRRSGGRCRQSPSLTKSIATKQMVLRLSFSCQTTHVRLAEETNPDPEQIHDNAINDLDELRQKLSQLDSDQLELQLALSCGQLRRKEEGPSCSVRYPCRRRLHRHRWVPSQVIRDILTGCSTFPIQRSR